LLRYLDKQIFRINTRKGNNQEQFLSAMSSLSGLPFDLSATHRTNDGCQAG
jgi:hypothetical protein